jgi:hypothetical protein
MGGGRLARNPLDLIPADFEGPHDCLCLSHCKESVDAAFAGFRMLRKSADDYGSNLGFFGIDRHGLPSGCAAYHTAEGFPRNPMDRTRHHRPGVLDLDPVSRRPRPIGCRQPLRHDALQAHFARVKAGLERARAEGKTLGRPTITASTDAAIRKALKKGDTGIRKFATTLGVRTGTVQRQRCRRPRDSATVHRDVAPGTLWEDLERWL